MPKIINKLFNFKAMTIEEKSLKFNELKQIEETLREKRDFHGLIKVYEDSLSLFDTISNRLEMLPKKAYCHARLGQKSEAEETLKRLKSVIVFTSKDELFRAVTLVTFFLNIDALELNTFQKTTIKNWLKEPDASKQVIQIVFDYPDIIEDIIPFDRNRLLKRQTYFSIELIAYVFLAMSRSEDKFIYYNRETNDVQQVEQGFLTSLIDPDQLSVNKQLANKISNSDNPDPIIDGIHFLIPKLKLSDFIEKIIKTGIDYNKIHSFVDEFKEIVMEEYTFLIDSFDELFLDEKTSLLFFNHLDSWCKRKNIEIEEIEDFFNEAGKEFALDFLRKANL